MATAVFSELLRDLEKALDESDDSKELSAVISSVGRLLELEFHALGDLDTAALSRALRRATSFCRPKAQREQKKNRRRYAALTNAQEELCLTLSSYLVKIGLERTTGEAIYNVCTTSQAVMESKCGGARVLDYLISRALADGVKAAAVKRAWAARETLESGGEFETSFRATAARAAVHPGFMKLQNGRGLVALMLAHPQLSDETHAAIKAQLPLGSQKLAVAYGECYFESWEALRRRTAAKKTKQRLRHAEDWAELEDFERRRFQELARSALLCRCDDLHSRLRALLGSALHERKGTSPKIDSAIDRVYAPLLWRGLSAAHAKCRARSVELLADAFPILSESDDTEVAVERQLEAVRVALSDPCPDVRRAAAEASGSILSRFADILPAAKSAEVIKLLGQTCRDASSSDVRCAALEAFGRFSKSARSLFGNAADRYLKKALTACQRCVHDVEPRCREAFFGALAAYAKYVSPKPEAKAALDIVDAEDLVARLRTDHDACPNVARLIVDLVISDAYFPSDRALGAVHIERAVAFATKDSIAAQAFYSRLACVVPLDSCAKFIIMLAKGAAAAVDEPSRSHRQGNKRRRVQEGEDNESNSDEMLETGSNVTATMLEVAATVANALFAELDQQASDDDLHSYVSNGLCQPLESLSNRGDDDTRLHLAVNALRRHVKSSDASARKNVDLVRALATVDSPTRLEECAGRASQCRDEALLARLCNSLLASLDPTSKRRSVPPAIAVFVLSHMLSGPSLTAAKAAVLRVYERLSAAIANAINCPNVGPHVVDMTALIDLDAALAANALFGASSTELRRRLDTLVCTCQSAVASQGAQSQPRSDGRQHQSRSSPRLRRRSEGGPVNLANASRQNQAAAALETALGVRDWLLRSSRPSAPEADGTAADAAQCDIFSDASPANDVV